MKAQGASTTDPKKLKPGKYTYTLKAPKKGKVTLISNSSISRIARIAGASNDIGAGIYLHRHCGDRVNKGDMLMTIYAEGKERLKFATHALKEWDGIKVR